MRGTWSVNPFIKCSEPCVSRTEVRSQSYFHLSCVSPSCSFTPLSLRLSACQALFISRGEDFRTDHWRRRLGSAVFALSYWFHRCLEVNDTQHLMILSYVSNKGMKGKVTRGKRRGAQGSGKGAHQQLSLSFTPTFQRPVSLIVNGRRINIPEAVGI